MADFTDNQAILQALLGTGATAPPTTLGTGTFNPNPNEQQFGGQLPQIGNPIENNPNFMATGQQFFGSPGQPSTFNNPIKTPPNHSVGSDSWTSGIRLGHQDILNNIGLGGNQNAR